MISSLKTAIGYNTNGSQKRFPFPNALLDEGHLEITLDDIPVESGYTVTLQTNRDLGAVVEFTAAPATGQVLVISRATPITQEETFAVGSNFDGDKFEGGLDKLTMIIQERGFVCGDCVPLDAPIILSATAVGTDQIDLVWTDNTDDETGFEIQRSLDGETGWTTVASPAANATTHSDTGLDDDTEYFYRVRAVGGVLESEWSNIVSAITDLAIPAAPSGLTATEAGTDTINLAWTDNSDNEASFEIQRSLDGSTGWLTVLTPAANATSASDTGLTEGTQYFYRIRSTNAAGSSAFTQSEEVTLRDGTSVTLRTGELVYLRHPANDFTLPAAPSSLVATAISDTQIDLTWVDNSGSETSFSIERSLDGSTGWTEVLTPAANATSASDTGLTAGTEYFYRIKALRDEDSSAYSNTDSATTESTVTLIAHYDADSFADGATWQDETANGHDLTKNGNPVNATGFNGTGEDYVDFDGAGDYFRVLSLPVGLLEDDGASTIFWVARYRTSPGFLLFEDDPSRVRVGLTNSSGGQTVLERVESGAAHFANYPVVGSSIGYVIVGLRIDGVNSTLRVNELDASDNTPPVSSVDDATGWNFGAQPGFSSHDFDGEIAEILIYSGAMSDSDWNSKFEELGTKYNITVTPHP